MRSFFWKAPRLDATPPGLWTRVVRVCLLLIVLLSLVALLRPDRQIFSGIPFVADLPYFPEGPESGIPGYGSRGLEAMREPSLWNLSRKGKGASYRFLCVPSFSRAFAVRVEKTVGGADLRMIELAEEEGSPTNRIKAERTLALSPGQWADLDALAEKSGFWAMPPADDRVVSDGTAFIVEGVRDGRYLGVHRQSPSLGPYRRLCLYMLSLAGPGHPKLDGDHEPLSVKLGNFAVVKSRTLAVAVRIVEHTKVGRGGSDYGGAAYEWALQADGSGDFSKDNVVKGKGSVLGAPNYRPEEMAIVCGPLTLDWSPCYEDRDYLSVRRAASKVAPGEKIGLADTDWAELKEVDLRNKYLIWSYGP